MRSKPRREPKNWKSEGPKVLARVTHLNNQFTQKSVTEFGPVPDEIGPLVIDFYHIVEPMSRGVHLDSCHSPLRREIRDFARHVGLLQASFVTDTLDNLLAGEKAKKAKQAAAPQPQTPAPDSLRRSDTYDVLAESKSAVPSDEKPVVAQELEPHRPGL